MRNPNRINLIIDKLRELWIEHPDWRLCQLISNVTGMHDPFYCEDNQLLDGICSYLHEDKIEFDLFESNNMSEKKELSHYIQGM